MTNQYVLGKAKRLTSRTKEPKTTVEHLVTSRHLVKLTGLVIVLGEGTRANWQGEVVAFGLLDPILEFTRGQAVNNFTFDRL